jgi:hypothetical protein
MRDPILARARRAVLKLYRDGRLQPSWPREAKHQADQSVTAKPASSGPAPSDRDRTAPVPRTVRGPCGSDTVQARTRDCGEHSSGNKALSRMWLSLHPRAARVVGHRAKDELTERAAAARRQRCGACPTPIAAGRVQTVLLTGRQPTGSLMSGIALHPRSNRRGWRQAAVPAASASRRREWVRAPSTIQDHRFSPPVRD